VTADYSSKKIDIIPLGRLASQHGYEKQGRIAFKVDLFSRGGLSLKEAKHIFLSPDEGQSWEKNLVLSPPKPLGGEWGSQSRLILELSLENSWVLKYFEKKLKNPLWIGLERVEIQKTLKGQEFLVWDLLGCQVLESQRPEKRGRVSSVFDPYENVRSGETLKQLKQKNNAENRAQLPSVTLEITRPDGSIFSVPSSWIQGFDFQKKVLRFETLEDWENLE
jgi:hypothetical protein